MGTFSTRIGRLLLIASIGLTPARPSAAQQTIRIDANVRHQTIEGWGASLAYWAPDRATYENPAWRQAWRDLGLNILRVDMKKDVLIAPSGDLAEKVELGTNLQDNLARFNFDHPKVRVFGQFAQWLSANAFEPERVRIVGSVWSPPHWMKESIGAPSHHISDPDKVRRETPFLYNTDSVGGTLRQTPENLEDYGQYLAAWVTGFEQRYGTPMYAISLQNEATFQNPFDSMVFHRGPKKPDGSIGDDHQWWQYASALAAVKQAWRQHGIRTKIQGPHLAHLGASPSNTDLLTRTNRFIEAVKQHPDPTLIDFLDYYNSNAYMSPNDGGARLWAAHLHGYRNIPPGRFGSWQKGTYAPGVKGDGKPLWASETGGEIGDWLVSGKPGDAGRNGAILTAVNIHNALVYGNVSAYLYWMLSDAQRRETVHTLLGVDRIDNPLASKKYAAFRHFSRFIRPGAQRISAAFDNGATVSGNDPFDVRNGLNVSAFLHDGDRTLTCVLLNLLPEDRTVTLQLPRDLTVTPLQVHLTDSSRSFARLSDLTPGPDRALRLNAPAYSVMTLVTTIAPAVPASEPATGLDIGDGRSAATRRQPIAGDTEPTRPTSP